MKNIILQYNNWYLLLILLIGITYSFILYYKQKHLKDKSIFLVLLLAFIRFITVSAISFLLLTPLFKFVSEQKSKPIVVIAQDYSASLQNTYKDSKLAEINTNIKSIKNELSDKYEVQEFSLGEDITPGLKDSFNLKSTNISKYIDYVNQSFDDKELSAVILSSDGIYNEGINPGYINLKLNAPFYTIALGDTTIKKDIFINNVYYNEIAFLGDKIGIKVDVQAKSIDNKKVKLLLYSITESGKSKLIDSKQININTKDFFTTEYFITDAKSSGVSQYRVSVTKLKDEISYKNNSKNIFIEVIDSKVKILLLANNPHPDLGSIKESLLNNKNYEVSIKYPFQSFHPEAFDLIIYHNLPSKVYDISTINNLATKNGIPEFYIIGSKTNQNRLNKIQNILKIKGNSNSFDESQAIVNKDFNLFLTDVFTDKGLDRFPPLSTPFGEYSISPKARVLLYQQINKIKTKRPLLLLNTDTNKKVAILTGSNIFKWRLFDFYQYQNNEIISSLLSQIVQYLTIKKDKSQWRVKASKNIYKEQETIEFVGELYNDNYEQINKPEAYLKITDTNSKEYEFVFTRTNNSYTLNAGVFPTGNYKYFAYVKIDNKLLKKNGKFSIVSKDLEKYDLVANHTLLNKLSTNTGGKLYQANEISDLVNDLKSKEAKPIIFYGQKTKKIIDFKWLFWLFLSLLSIEWFVRRYNGTF